MQSIGDIKLALVKTRKVGGSLVVTLPKELVEEKKIREGEVLEIIVRKVKKDGFPLSESLFPSSLRRN
ncbi:TPA: AbrB/MazE/SpoVT family DNA-binding domain-containing protein [Candidatus Bathyarchaeota archaeon]|nr:AbrB/MazE/SpoVT family DNA-binding domain-containing protein [Candidatus Bathyarchaeota archaeon]